MFHEVNSLFFELLYLNHFPFELSYLGCVTATGDSGLMLCFSLSQLLVLF